MTAFDNYETSASDGQPITLYEFVRSSGGIDVYWRYNSSDEDITYSGNIYSSIPISDDGVKQTGEATSAEFTVTLPITATFCQDFRLSGAVPSDIVYLTVRKIHYADLTDARVVWKGEVSGVTQTDEITAKLTCSTLAASFRRGGLRYGWQRSCPHILYGSECRADKEVFRTLTTADTVVGNIVGAAPFATQPNGWYDGGWLEYVVPSGLIERRMIVSHTGTDLTLISVPVELVVGMAISAFGGCDRVITTCIDKFDNLPNFGGFPHTPGKSPFDGDPVF